MALLSKGGAADTILWRSLGWEASLGPTPGENRKVAQHWHCTGGAGVAVVRASGGCKSRGAEAAVPTGEPELFRCQANSRRDCGT